LEAIEDLEIDVSGQKPEEGGVILNGVADDYSKFSHEQGSYMNLVMIRGMMHLPSAHKSRPSISFADNRKPGRIVIQLI
jgi:hypothetical protein